MPWLLALVMRIGIPAKFAKPALIAAGVVLLILALGLGKCAYDRALIRNHEADQAAKIAPVVRKADAKAADARIIEERKIDAHQAEERKAVDALPDQGLSARQRARACSVLRRQAAERGRPAPAGC